VTIPFNRLWDSVPAAPQAPAAASFDALWDTAPDPLMAPEIVV
jgi:hypothetical protein